MSDHEELDLSLVQYEPEWCDSKANLGILNGMLNDLRDTDIIVLPEMFNTGFIDDPSGFSEEMNGSTVDWLKETAKRKNALVLGSIAIKENDKYYNRLIAAYPDQSLAYYDKKHLFSFGGEAKHFSPGHERKIIEYKSWKIALFVCYDLRFPVWTRNNDDYDIAIFVAAWPAIRSLAWRQLLMARAIENQSYVIGVNQVGLDGKGINYNGCSTIIDFEGLHLLEIRDKVMVAQKKIFKSKLSEFRSRFPFLQDRDKFELK